MNAGIWYAIGAFAAWGLLPVYWKLLQDVPAPQLLGHRILWSCLSLMTVILITRQWKRFRAETLNARMFRAYSIAAILIGLNWLIYVWAVNSGFVVETSLGYFINPLLSVLLGVLVLRERLRPWQWVPVGLAAAGVLYLTFVYGSLPWIALLLAFSFAFYGLIKKMAPLGSLYGLTLETVILLLPATGYLVFSESRGDGVFLHHGMTTDLLLIGAGLMTTLPLLLFASAAQRIPLSLVGILQYIAPTLQFLIGVLVYKETLTASRLTGFAIVWLALIIFAVEGTLARRGQVPSVVVEAE
jgi:chloramphenicol-sensitive protein RarD